MSRFRVAGGGRELNERLCANTQSHIRTIGKKHFGQVSHLWEWTVGSLSMHFWAAWAACAAAEHHRRGACAAWAARAAWAGATPAKA